MCVNTRFINSTWGTSSVFIFTPLQFPRSQVNSGCGWLHSVLTLLHHSSSAIPNKSGDMRVLFGGGGGVGEVLIYHLWWLHNVLTGLLDGSSWPVEWTGWCRARPSTTFTWCWSACAGWLTPSTCRPGSASAFTTRCATWLLPLIDITQPWRCTSPTCWPAPCSPIN